VCSSAAMADFAVFCGPASVLFCCYRHFRSVFAGRWCECAPEAGTEQAVPHVAADPLTLLIDAGPQRCLGLCRKSCSNYAIDEGLRWVVRWSVG